MIKAKEDALYILDWPQLAFRIRRYWGLGKLLQKRNATHMGETQY